jgi:Flp pilus assembly protein TadG
MFGEPLRDDSRWGLIRLSKRQLLADERGAAVIEMAFVAPVFALMIVGIADISNAYTEKVAIEQGAQRAIEKIMQTTQGETVDDTVKTEAVCQVNGTTTTGGVTTCNASPITADDVTVTYRLECTDSTGAVTVKTGVDAADDCPSGQTQAQYVSVNVVGKYTPLFPIHFAGYNSSDNSYHLSATAGMRTQ